jgi:hypothetical protein
MNIRRCLLLAAFELIAEFLFTLAAGQTENVDFQNHISRVSNGALSGRSCALST